MGARTYGGALPEPLAAVARFAGSPAGMFTGMLAAAKTAAAGGAEISALAEKAGISVEAISALSYAARRSEVPVESLASRLGRMARAIADAAQGGKAGTEALQAVGLSVVDITSLRPEEQFSLMANRIAAIESPTLRTAAAIKIFGRGGAELLPLLMQGGAGIDAFAQRARKLGLVLDADTAAQGRQFNQTLGDMSDVIKSGVRAIGGALVPVLNGATNILVRGLVAAQLDQGTSPLTVAVFGGVAAFVGAGVAVMMLGKALAVTAAIAGAIKVGITLLGAVVSGAAAVVSAAWSAATAVMSGFWAVAMAPLAALGVGLAGAAGAVLYFSGALGKLGSFAKGVFSTLWADATSAFKGIANAVSAGNLSLAWKIVTSTLSLEWTRFSNGLMDAWDGFCIAWDAAIWVLADVFTKVTATIRSLWAGMVGELAKLWEAFAVSAFTESVADMLAPLFAQVYGVDVADVQKNLAQDFATGRKNLGAKIIDIDTKTAKEQKKIQDEAAEARAILAGDFAGKAIARAGNILGREKELNDAIAERKKLLQQAADAADKARAKVPEEKFAGVDLSAGQKMGVVGTFNAAVVASLGMGKGVQERMVTALERLVKLDEDMLREVRTGGIPVA